MALAKRIIIAAGHGGGDSGATSGNLREYKEAIQIVDRVVSILKKDKQLEVVLVPHSLGLVGSINWINARYKKLLDGYAVEVHKNAGGGSGSEVWYPSGGDSFSKTSSRKVTNAIAFYTKLPNRGIKDASTNRWGKLGWTDDTNTYAMLIEAGFIGRDPTDDSMDQKYAMGIAVGLLNVWGLKLKAPTPKPPKPPVDACAAEKQTIERLNRELTEEKIKSDIAEYEKGILQIENDDLRETVKTQKSKIAKLDKSLAEYENKPTQSPLEVVRGLSWMQLFKYKFNIRS